MFKPSGLAYLISSNFNNILLIFGIGSSFHVNCLFRLLKSLRKSARFDLGSGCAKDGVPYSESFATSRNPSRNKRSTSFLEISRCTFVTGYSRKHIVFTSSFNLRSNVSVLQVPNVPSNNSSNICNNFSNSLHCVTVIFRHWVYTSLCKFAFLYLASNITRNRLVAVRTFWTRIPLLCKHL